MSKFTEDLNFCNFLKTDIRVCGTNQQACSEAHAKDKNGKVVPVLN
jgi:hypothetical protein